jgi:hypothetical protein
MGFVMPESAKGAIRTTTGHGEAKNVAGHRQVVVGLTFQSKEDHLGPKLGQLRDRSREVGKHRDAPEPGVGETASAAADLADALSGAASGGQLHAALARLRNVTKDQGEPLVHRRAGEKGAPPTAHLENELNKAQAALQRAEADLGRIAAAAQSAGGHASGVVNAGSGGQVANNVGGLFGDLAEGIDALGDLIGGPAGAALSALASLIGSIGDVVSTVFGSGTADPGPEQSNPGSEPGPDNTGEEGPPGGEDTGPGPGSEEGGCFTASTPVLMADGSRRPIGELAVGDVVLGRDERTGATGVAAVERVFVHRVGRTMTLRLRDGVNVETTSVHRFATAGGEFVDAGSLRPGDELATRDGVDVVLEETAEVVKPTTVYNLTVGRLHTYFVGEPGVWVHNAKKQEEPPPDDGDNENQNPD